MAESEVKAAPPSERPKRGGRQPGAGRPFGSRNRTDDVVDVIKGVRKAGVDHFQLKIDQDGKISLVILPSDQEAANTNSARIPTD